ncbi:hypothetical protein [Flavobacterium sp.]|uniref:hypothetical protein n=1 Tax=Flavobacterium sp. TaxID=239 RepID=UPI0037539BAB
MKKILCFLSAIVLITSCNDDEISKDSETSKSDNTLAMRTNENDKPDEQMPIVLGEKLKNPYTVANMQSAFDYYNSVVPNSPFEGKTVEATHYYIKITPSTIEQLEMLDELDNSDDENAPILQDYPLDYEIKEEGDYYVMPKDENDIYHSAYTLIPVNYQFPSAVSYEILDKIYEPTEEEYDVETAALFFANWQEDLLADDINITIETLPDYLINSLAEQSSNRLFGKRYRPNGYVKVENTDNQILEPLLKAKISIGRNVFWRYTYTDNNGYFEAPKKYRGKVRIRAKWRGYTATIRKTWNEILGLWVSDHLMTITRGNNGITKNIMYGEPHQGIFGIDLAGGHLWFKGTTHNGLRKYIDFSNSNGISNTVGTANVWCFAKGKNASTPMLHKYPQLAGMSTIANIGQANFWNVMTNVVGGIVVSLVPVHLRPDFIFAGLKDKKIKSDGQSNTVRIHQTIFHESGHFSHAIKAGASFWAQVYASEMSNSFLHGDSYLDGSYPSFTAAKRIGLAEGWGNFCEFKITSAIYGKAYMGSINGTNMYSSSNINTYMERFNIYDTPMSFTQYVDRHWFTHGVMWDVLDNQVDTNLSKHRNGDRTIIINDIVDNCFVGNSSNTNDLSSIFNRLSSSVETTTQFRDALINTYPTQATPIRNLFNSYGY